MSYLDSRELMIKGRKSKWFNVVMIIAGVQLLAYFAGFYLVISFLLYGKFYTAATVAVIIKIVLMWAVTITGMLWEKDVIDTYFLGKEFFWEDIGNLIAIVTHNAYFVVAALDFSKNAIMQVMLFAFISYLFNFVQWIIVGIKSYKMRKKYQIS